MVRTSSGSALFYDTGRRVESDGASLFPLDGEDCLVERVESVFDDVKWM